MTQPNESHLIRKIPIDLAGGEYVRNGGNPVANEALGRDAHWFDGDGMLTGVFFRQSSETGDVQPEFVNQYILTDVYLSTITSPALRSPLLPSIATLVNPLSSLIKITLRILRTLLLVLLSHLPGSKQAIKKISVANTAVLYHDGRALATCESGPPMRIALPGLGTVGWFNGDKCEGEPHAVGGSGFGGEGPLSFFREWTTAHPRIDPNTKELLLFHSTFVPPYVRYSILTPTSPKPLTRGSLSPRFQHAAVSGVHSAKMMHDFGVSRSHTVILDLPLALDPLNLAKNRPVVAYDPTSRSRFGVFPRYRPEIVRWYETRACCIFHTANTWDSITIDSISGEVLVESVNMLACRLTSASLVFSAGALAAPVPTRAVPEHEREEEQCRLYYYNFCLGPGDENIIRHQWALSAIPFEFPSLRDSATMSPAKYVYGCSVSDSSFGAALGRAVKMNALVKMDVESLIARGKHDPPKSISGCVDTRNVDEILHSKDADGPIKIFKMPEGWYAQESRFVPRQDGDSEDDGWLLSYVFDERQLQPDGECNPKAKSELWIINAKSMNEVAAKVQLPQRVPYGLHAHKYHDRSAFLELAPEIFNRELGERKICVQNCPRYWRPVQGPDGKCTCEPQNGTHEREKSVMDLRKLKLERSAQYNLNAGPLDCASIAKCPANQHAVNNAADGMCECVNDDTPNPGILDCAAIAKCPADQHPVYNNSAGQCQCIPDGPTPRMKRDLQNPY
ncbi:MAG: hypothetical protein Q9200_000022 [Gallowayella weberi]